MQQHSRGEVSLRVLCPGTAAALLQKQGIAAQGSADGVFTLPPLPDEALAALVQVLAAGGAGVVSLTPRTKTLEEIFLTLTQKEVP